MTGSSHRRSLVLSALLIVSLSVGIAAFSGTAVAEPDCGTVSYSGSGTSGDPYQVGTVDQLQCMENQGLSNHYELTSDIAASGTSSWNDGSGFDPIGASGNQFTGTFDGNGHTISGLTIDRGSLTDVALFGEIGEGAVIRNVGLEGGSMIGGDSTGALVGYNFKGTVEDSYATADVSGRLGVGGLVGNNYGTIRRSFATGDVDGSYQDAGGLVGYNGQTVSRSYATGDVNGVVKAGGLVAHNSGGVITRSYATGTVSGDSQVGGLVGSDDGGATTTRSYWDETAYGSSDAGTGLTTSEMQGSSAETNMDLDFTSTWDTVESGDPTATADGYPILRTLDRKAQLEAQGLYTLGTSSITRSSPTSQETNADSVDFAVTFSESVENVSPDDFTTSGSASGTADSVSSASGSTITVTVASISGDGSLGLDLAAGGDITDTDGNRLATTEPAIDETYIIDNTAPGFESSASATVDEGTTGTVLDVEADDGTASPDTNADYALGGVDAAPFSIDTNSGEVSLDSPQEFENPRDDNTDGAYELTVTATDGVGNSDQQSVTVTIDDVDETPSFTSGSAVSVAEDAVTDDSVSDTDATVGGDADEGVRYAITSGNGDGTYTIDESTGEITVADASRIDHESESSETLTVEAREGSATVTQTLTVSITDVDEQPSFTSATAAAVAESESQGTLVQDVNADVGGDADDGLSYAITAGNDDVAGDGGTAFAIDSASGEITIDDVDDIDSSARSRFSLDVTASEGTASQTQTVTVTVDDDVVPTVDSFGISNPSGQDVQVSFDSTEQLSTIAASVSGAESATLSAGDFSESGSGPYTYTATYSGSSDGTYDVALSTAEDAAGNDGSQPVGSSTVLIDTTAPGVTGVTLVDGTDGNGVVTVGETVQVTATVTDSNGISTVDADASAFDAGTVTLADDGPNSASADDQYSATVTVSSAPTEGAQSVTVSATDTAGNGGSQAVGSGTLTVDTTAPSFVSSATASVPENTEDPALDVNADAGSGADTDVTYALVGGPDQSAFTIDTATGALSFTSAPDFEDPTDADDGNDYVVDVQATDAFGNSQTQTVTVSVTNVDETSSAPAVTVDAGTDVTVEAGERATFAATASNTVGDSSYRWYFGDGDSADGRSVTHAYDSPGTYIARVAMDDSGNEDTDTVAVSVVANTSTEPLGSGEVTSTTPTATAATPTPDRGETPEPSTVAASVQTASNTEQRPLPETPPASATDTTPMTTQDTAAATDADQPADESTTTASGPGFGPGVTLAAAIIAFVGSWVGRRRDSR